MVQADIRNANHHFCCVIQYRHSTVQLWNCWNMLLSRYRKASCHARRVDPWHVWTNHQPASYPAGLVPLFKMRCASIHSLWYSALARTKFCKSSSYALWKVILQKSSIMASVAMRPCCHAFRHKPVGRAMGDWVNSCFDCSLCRNMTAECCDSLEAALAAQTTITNSETG